MQRGVLCVYWRELSSAYFLAKFGFDTAENEPFQVCRIPTTTPRSRFEGSRLGTGARRWRRRPKGRSCPPRSSLRGTCKATSPSVCESHVHSFFIFVSWKFRLLVKIGKKYAFFSSATTTASRSHAKLRVCLRLTVSPAIDVWFSRAEEWNQQHRDRIEEILG